MSKKVVDFDYPNKRITNLAIIKVLIAGLILLCSNIAIAQELYKMDGKTFLTHCTKVLNVIRNSGQEMDGVTGVEVGHCIGFVEGFTGLNTVYKEMIGKPLFCPPADGSITTQEGVQILANYLKQNPAELHRRVDVLATVAFMKAYPCK